MERFRVGAALNEQRPETFYGSARSVTRIIRRFEYQTNNKHMMKKILAFSGSLRAGSYNQKLVKIAEDGGLLNAEYTAKVNAIGWKLAGV